MGQKSSHLNEKLHKSKIPLIWLLRTERTISHTSPQQPIKFQYKTKRKGSTKCNKENGAANDRCIQLNNSKLNNDVLNERPNNTKDTGCRIVKTQNAPLRTKSESCLTTLKKKSSKHRRRRKSTRMKNDNAQSIQQFGYEIQDVDDFLTKVSTKLFSWSANCSRLSSKLGVRVKTILPAHADEFILLLVSVLIDTSTLC